MSSLRNIPQLHKGALCQGPLVIPFQYNPETLTRTLEANSVNSTQLGTDSLRLTAPPKETIQLEILLDATEQVDPGTVLSGKGDIYPALSALEMLVYPSVLRMAANSALSAAGMLEVIPPSALPTVLVWGYRRVLPVRISAFSITEEIFDADLNPIRARIALGLQVLNYVDLGVLSVGGLLSMANHVLKEALGGEFEAFSDASLTAKVVGANRMGGTRPASQAKHQQNQLKSGVRRR